MQSNSRINFRQIIPIVLGKGGYVFFYAMWYYISYTELGGLLVADKRIDVPTEAMPDIRKVINQANPKAKIHRFAVDCHNGVSYFNKMLDYATVNAEMESDERVLDYIRNTCYKEKKCKVYSCIELFGDTQLSQLPTIKEEDLPKHVRLVFYNKDWEPLSAYSKMI